ncbi:MAG: phosphate signaling complex protein PhoU [Ignavibacteriales bacterium]|nr:phosphate signaling complex protein PhoU [Ignavibacteriales bacterium]MBI3788153.1 phosphate signaling complex protein PhoU [Ignavibacteriales bacterium]
MPRHFEYELDQLRTMLIRMGSLVEEQIDLGVRAILESNTSLAQIVLERDKKVDEFDNEIDKQCMRIFALTQPVAIDLRLLMAALKINNELERIGDIAVNLAERVTPLLPHAIFVKKTPLAMMAEGARAMVKDAIDSFVNSDPALAKKVLESDDAIDELDRETFNLMVKKMKESSEFIEPAAHMMIVSRHVERLADHATNIAEDVIFLVNAKIIKHHANDSATP